MYLRCFLFSVHVLVASCSVANRLNFLNRGSWACWLRARALSGASPHGGDHLGGQDVGNLQGKLSHASE
jgi:hypothetical protein